MENVTSLEGLRTGVYVVTTSGGTRHVVDLERGSATRYGAAGRAWTHMSSPDGAADGEPFFFTRISDAAVGKRMYLFYKGGYTDSDFWRLTSAVGSIEEFDINLGELQRLWGISEAELANIIGADEADVAVWKSGGVGIERRQRVIDLVMATEVLSGVCASSGRDVSELVRRLVWGEDSLLSLALGEDSYVVLYALAMELAALGISA